MVTEGIFAPKAGAASIKRGRGRPPGPGKPKPLPDIDELPASALATTAQVSRVAGFSESTLKLWRTQNRGPSFVMVEGAPRYPVGLLRRWLAGQQVAAE